MCANADKTRVPESKAAEEAHFVLEVNALIYIYIYFPQASFFVILTFFPHPFLFCCFLLGSFCDLPRRNNNNNKKRCVRGCGVLGHLSVCDHPPPRPARLFSGHYNASRNRFSLPTRCMLSLLLHADLPCSPRASMGMTTALKESSRGRFSSSAADGAMEATPVAQQLFDHLLRQRTRKNKV